MDVVLNRLWDGSAAPDGVGGTVSLQRRNGRLRLGWSLRMPAPPRIPAEPVGFTNGLWEWDVLEVFLRGKPESAESYVELELGPAGHWLAFAFRGARRRVAELREPAPHVSGTVRDGAWTGQAEWAAAGLEAYAGSLPWSGLVTAVVGSGASRAYLSVPALPGEKPDFHQPDAWMPLDLEPPWDR